MYNYKSLMNVLSYVLSFCKCEKEIDFDPETIEVLRAIYRDKEPYYASEGEEYEETDSEDSDYEPTSDIEEDDESDAEGEEIIIKKDKEGNYYIY